MRVQADGGRVADRPYAPIAMAPATGRTGASAQGRCSADGARRRVSPAPATPASARYSGATIRTAATVRINAVRASCQESGPAAVATWWADPLRSAFQTGSAAPAAGAAP